MKNAASLFAFSAALIASSAALATQGEPPVQTGSAVSGLVQQMHNGSGCAGAEFGAAVSGFAQGASGRSGYGAQSPNYRLWSPNTVMRQIGTYDFLGLRAELVVSDESDPCGFTETQGEPGPASDRG